MPSLTCSVVLLSVGISFAARLYGLQLALTHETLTLEPIPKQTPIKTVVLK